MNILELQKLPVAEDEHASVAFASGISLGCALTQVHDGAVADSA